MMIVMKETASAEEIDAVVAKIERAGALAHRSQGARVTVIGAIGDVEQDVSVEALAAQVSLCPRQFSRRFTRVWKQAGRSCGACD